MRPLGLARSRSNDWDRSRNALRIRRRDAHASPPINIFVSLPMKSLDALTLQKQLDAIGKNEDRAPDPAKEAE